MDILKLTKGFKLKSLGKAMGLKERVSRADFGILKVAFMVAALDGEVTEAEYQAFDVLAKKCRGYTPEIAAKALDEAMRSAGYLILKSRRVTDAELVKAFLVEAKCALPSGFAYLSVEDVRRAVVMWIAMGLSDGDYSPRERKCIEALRKHFAELKILRLQMQEEQWLSLAPAFSSMPSGRGGVGEDSAERAQKVELVSKEFVSRVERLIAQYGDSAAAEREFKELVSAG